MGLEKHLFLAFLSQGKVNIQFYQLMSLVSGAEENGGNNWTLRADTAWMAAAHHILQHTCACQELLFSFPHFNSLAPSVHCALK